MEEPGRPREFHTLEIDSSNLSCATINKGRSPSWTKAPDFDSGNRTFESCTVCQEHTQYRGVAQLAARLLWEHQVADSISAAPTTQERDRANYIVLSWKPASKIGRRRNS